MKKILFIFGTRPEAIKMAPVIKKFRKYPDDFSVKVCVTAQHREMLNQVLEFFKITADYDLNLMQKDQTLYDITSQGIKKLENVLSQCKPDMIFVQGDTTTSFIGALAGFYKKIKVAHIEAGLRSNDKFAPFPEEINRKLISHIADFHFSPTIQAEKNLLNEGIKSNIFTVGNTVIDALYSGLDLINNNDDEFYKFFNFIDFSKKIILVTGHRRESFGKPFENICLAIKEISEQSGIEFVYPVHLNPNVQKPVNKILSKLKNVHLLKPLEYPQLIWLMNKSYIVLTDSGGIQEESPSLGKPVLVMRDVTERQEGIDAGTALLVGTSKENIISSINLLLQDKDKYSKMAKAVNPYGDGKASDKIVEIIKDRLNIISNVEI